MNYYEPYEIDPVTGRNDIIKVYDCEYCLHYETEKCKKCSNKRSVKNNDRTKRWSKKGSRSWS